jgi:hypothetical protein
MKARNSAKSRTPNQGVVKWLLACPEKDFVVAIESESTGSLWPTIVSEE